jgi:DNA-directed RNA polymerase beta' subunit
MFLLCTTYSLRPVSDDTDVAFITSSHCGQLEGYSGDEWEDRKRRIRKVFLIRRMQLAKHFIQTIVEPEWMVLCLLPVLPPELRQRTPGSTPSN